MLYSGGGVETITRDAGAVSALRARAPLAGRALGGGARAAGEIVHMWISARTVCGVIVPSPLAPPSARAQNINTAVDDYSEPERQSDERDRQRLLPSRDLSASA